jgi:excisionase family DNA binding protein
MQSELTELLTPDDVTRILKIGRRTLYRMIKARRIPAVKVGGRLRFRREQLLEWLESAATTPARPPKRILVVDDDDETR